MTGGDRVIILALGWKIGASQDDGMGDIPGEVIGEVSPGQVAVYPDFRPWWHHQQHPHETWRGICIFAAADLEPAHERPEGPTLIRESLVRLKSKKDRGWYSKQMVLL